MTDEELAAWLPRSLDGYVADRVRSGESLGEATTIATAQRAAAFPGGTPAPGHVVCNVLVEETVVGVLWLGPSSPADRAGRYVYQVEVLDGLRGRGYGRAAMCAAEAWARADGATRLSLNVFGFNATARALYDSLGYVVGSSFHGKVLAQTDAPDRGSRPS